MKAARLGGYAIGYFESWSLDSLQGVIDAAEKVRAPVIIGFNGEFLSERSGAEIRDLPVYGAMGVAIAGRADVPVGLIFNECRLDNWTEKAATSGFNLIMPAGGDPMPGAFTRRVGKLAAHAHKHGVAIESEVEGAHGLVNGEIAHGLGHHHNPTEPEEAVDFVRATSVDLLAVVVGNEEIVLNGRSSLDLNRLEAIRRVVDIPLVLHGGSGIDDASIGEAIKLNVRKINYGTYIKQRYLSHARTLLGIDEPNPHALLGDGGNSDLMAVGRRVVCDAVLERIELLGCCGKA
jgi:fructose/tagatose bisphosphate aldolase